VSEILAHGGAAECLAYNVLTDAGSLAARLGAWRPTLLCYFATPFISVGTKGDFSSQKFTEFCEYYVRGFNDTICALRRQGNELRSVLCASSSLVVEVPANLGEYVAAKSAAESLCRWLQQCDPNIRVHAPRFPRLATDQTAGILAAELPSPDVDVLEALRALRASPEAARLADPSAGW
jgi:NAD(P)-dependent dehydrogenase (short-subunit alcohol dehydrogenase family)